MISIDLLGHGGSDKPRSGYEITDQANAIAEALAELGVTDATVVGHSLGALGRHRARRAEPRARDEDRQHRPGARRQLRRPLLPGQAGYAPVIGQAMKRVADVAPTSAVRDQFRARLRPGLQHRQRLREPRPGRRGPERDDLHGVRRRRSTPSRDYTDARPLDDRLSALEIPVLVIFGAEDQIYDAEAAIEPYEDIPGVQTELLEGAGHSPERRAPRADSRTLITAFADAPTPEEKAAAKAAKRRAAKKTRGGGEAGQGRKAEETGRVASRFSGVGAGWRLTCSIPHESRQLGRVSAKQRARSPGPFVLVRPCGLSVDRPCGFLRGSALRLHRGLPCGSPVRIGLATDPTGCHLSVSSARFNLRRSL